MFDCIVIGYYAVILVASVTNAAAGGLRLWEAWQKHQRRRKRTR